MMTFLSGSKRVALEVLLKHTAELRSAGKTEEAFQEILKAAEKNRGNPFLANLAIQWGKELDKPVRFKPVPAKP